MGCVGGFEKGRVKIVRKRAKERAIWERLLRRCYNEKHHREKPTYKGCEVSENFKDFLYFKDWCNKQVGFNSKDEKGRSFALDKDILIRGNKVYSEDTCCFVPADINNLVIKANSIRGKYMIGVSYNKMKGRFESYINVFGSKRHLGTFNTELEAFYAYKEAKEAYIKEVAEKYKDQIDPRVYEVLMKYQVEITD